MAGELKNAVLRSFHGPPSHLALLHHIFGSRADTRRTIEQRQ